MKCSALFLDRDGVINVDRGYIHRSAQFEFVPGIFELARFWTNELRRPIVVITNQSGIGRGYFDEWAYEDLTRWMCERFEAEHTSIARVYHCPKLGDISIHRDWGWAPDYVEAMWLMLQHDQPEDFVIASGVAHRLEEFVSAAFAEVGLAWQDHVEYDASLRRPTDIRYSRGDASKAARQLGWRSRVGFAEIISRMVRAEQEKRSQFAVNSIRT